MLKAMYGSPESTGVINDASSPMETRAYGDVKLTSDAQYSMVKHLLCVTQCFIIFVPNCLRMQMRVSILYLSVYTVVSSVSISVSRLAN